MKKEEALEWRKNAIHSLTFLPDFRVIVDFGLHAYSNVSLNVCFCYLFIFIKVEID